MRVFEYLGGRYYELEIQNEDTKDVICFKAAEHILDTVFAAQFECRSDSPLPPRLGPGKMFSSFLGDLTS